MQDIIITKGRFHLTDAIKDADVYVLIGVVLPETPPLVTEGHLIGNLSSNGNRWIYGTFSGKAGSSDITGTLKYQRIIRKMELPINKLSMHWRMKRWCPSRSWSL